MDCRVTETDPELAEAFKQAMRRVASTVNVISICVDGQPMGITATAVSAVSMDPPSLLVCVNQAASVHAADRGCRRISTSTCCTATRRRSRTIFADRKLEAQRFIRGWDNDCVTPAAAARTPRRRSSAAGSTITASAPTRIFIGVVEEVAARTEVDPLIYLDGRFGGLRLQG